ncbi:hypothetical protein JCM11491_003454 [Sporobolomyces phaffii]
MDTVSNTLFSLVPAFLRPTWIGPKRSLVLGLICGFSLSLSLTSLAGWASERWKLRWSTRPLESRDIEVHGEHVVAGVEGLIGNTPLIRINSLSDALGVEILGKCEYLNPFGSVKDRVSLRIIQRAEDEGLIAPGDTGATIFEGTSGSTGISIAGIARARGYRAHIVVPDDVAHEKIHMLEVLGATVEKVRPVSIVDKRHYVNLARLRAHEAHLAGAGGGVFADQFENLANFDAHATSTAPEIWAQTAGFVDAFVSGAGTGGTIAGVGTTLKRLSNGRCQVVLGDPEGSGLYYWVREGVMWSEREEEGKRRRFQVDTIVEGIGLNRITQNLKRAVPILDDAYRVTDREALSMSRHLAAHDGLFLGSSSAVNLVTCVRLAQRWNRDRHADALGVSGTRPLQVVTILCDSGARHTSKFWNEDYLVKHGIEYPENLDWLLKTPSDPSPPHVDAPSPIPEPRSSRPTTTTEGVDHGEVNLARASDPDYASSAPNDLPAL